MKYWLCNPLGEPWKQCAKWQKPDTKGYILWFFSYEIARTGKTSQKADEKLLGGGGGNGETQSD